MSEAQGIFDAWVAGQRAVAFEGLCRLWAQTQDVELMELCERLSEQLVRARVEALEREFEFERVQGELIRAARTGDRVAVHALLPWLVGLERPKGRQKLVMLDPRDPVLLRWLMDWHLRRPELNELALYLEGHRSHWRDQLWAWRQRDSEWPRPVFERRTGVLHRFRAPRPSPRATEPDESRAIAIVRAQLDDELTDHQRQARRLLDAVYDDPTDDGPRAVLADYLLSHDESDPRGEFIVLQLRAAQGPLPEAARARERELLDRHGLRWLGELGPHCNLWTVQFERGFVVRVDLFAVIPADLAGRPFWATVERLNNATWAIVSHPRASSVRELLCDYDCAHQLLGGPVRPRIERLTVSFTHPSAKVRPPDETILRRAWRLFARLEAVPNLRRLGIRDPISPNPSAWSWMWQGPRATLEWVRLRIDTTEQLNLRAWFEQLLEDAAQPELQLDHGQLRYRLRVESSRRVVGVAENFPRVRQPLQRPLLLGFIGATLAPALSSSPAIDRVEVDAAVDVEHLHTELDARGVDLSGIELVQTTRAVR